MSIYKTNSTYGCQGDYVVIWNDDKQILFGPEQIFGDLLCPLNFFTDSDKATVEQFILDNSLTSLPENLIV